MIDFEGQVAVVTGAGRGLGRLYAIDLARRGGSDTAVADEVVDAITKAGGKAIVDSALENFGRLDAVVSNAGIFKSIPFDQLSTNAWRHMLRVNLDGGFYLRQPRSRGSAMVDWPTRTATPRPKTSRRILRNCRPPTSSSCRFPSSMRCRRRATGEESAQCPTTPMSRFPNP